MADPPLKQRYCAGTITNVIVIPPAQMLSAIIVHVLSTDMRKGSAVKVSDPTSSLIEPRVNVARSVKEWLHWRLLNREAGMDRSHSYRNREYVRQAGG